MISKEYPTTPSLETIPSLVQSDTTDIEIATAEVQTSRPMTKLNKSDYYIYSSSDFDEILDDASDETDYYFDNDTPITHLFPPINDNMIFEQHGYHKLYKISDTLQGTLWKASKINNRESYVAIKKTNKLLFHQRIAKEDGFNFCVSENILKETLILQYLTSDNQCIGDYIVKYIDYFESETDYYLVTEYIESEITLHQFIIKSRQLIQCGKLSVKQYNKMIKYLLWQLVVTVQWLHLCMKCCHLDLCSDNVMVKNAHFVETKSGEIDLGSNISIKLCDFGVAEIFHHDFICEKQGLSIYNEGYFAPNVFNGEMYDARRADDWSLGMILFECMTIGQQLYKPSTMYDYGSGYFALHHDRLHEYLGLNNVLHHFTKESFSLLKSLLNINEKERLHGTNVLKHPWFKMYYSRYKKQISKKFKHQHYEITDLKFPFYGNGI